MDRPKYKSINFDLDTNKMKELGLYPNGYALLGKALNSQGFYRRQGSGYVSKNRLNSDEVNDAVWKIVVEVPWLVSCKNRFDVSNVSQKQYDMNSTIDRFGAMLATQQKNNLESAQKKLSAKDESVLSTIRSSKVGTEFNQLYSGKMSSDDADMKLMAICQFFTNGDNAQAERIFKSSKLYNEGKGADYVQNLIAKSSKSNIALKQKTANNNRERSRYNGSSR